MGKVLDWLLVKVSKAAMPERNDRPKPKHEKKPKGDK